MARRLTVAGPRYASCVADRPEERPADSGDELDPEDLVEDDPIDEMERESFPASDPHSGWAGPPDP